MPATPTTRYYFVDRGNSGGFYVRFHRREGDEPLFNATPHTYDTAQEMVDRFNRQCGYVEPVDEDFREEDEED